MLKGMQTPSRAAIRVERDADGYVVRCATSRDGPGRAPLDHAAGAPSCSGASPDRSRSPIPDTDIVPFDTRTTSSRSTYMMGRARSRRPCATCARNGGAVGVGEVGNEGGLDPDTGQGIASTHWHQGAAGARGARRRGDRARSSRRACTARSTPAASSTAPGAELQNEGSMIMGLGTALFEEIDFADGQVTNANLSDYHVPAFADLPAG